MRIQRFLRCPHEIRRAVLSGGDPVHYFRSRSGVPVSLGGGLRETGADRVLVDDRVPRCAHRRVRLRMEERRAGMGLSPVPTKPGFAPAIAKPVVGPAATGIITPTTSKPVAANEPYVLAVNHELSDKGFF